VLAARHQLPPELSHKLDGIDAITDKLTSP
jgi:hypothetical protein